MKYDLMPLSLELVEINKNKYQMKATLEAIQKAYLENETGVIIGQCKSLIESFSKSILDEFNVVYGNDAPIGRLTKKAVETLNIGADTLKPQKTKEAYKKLITSFSQNIESAAKGIGELRNDFCPLAHGRSIYQNKLDMSYAVFIAKQTDSLVWFMHELRIKSLAPKDDVIIQNRDFDEYLNDEYSAIQILDDIYQPAEILWNANPNRYYTAFLEYQELRDEDEIEDELEESSVPAHLEQLLIFDKKQNINSQTTQLILEEECVN